MPNATAPHRPATVPADPPAAPARRRQRLTSYLVTADDALWPQVGAHLGDKLTHRQIDSVEELLAAAPSGECAVVLWDARSTAQPQTVLSRLQMHSPRFAIVALDSHERTAARSAEIERSRIVGVLDVPVLPDAAQTMLANACEEAHARLALLGAAAPAPITVEEESSDAADAAAHRASSRPIAKPAARSRPRRTAAIAAAGLAGLAVVALGGYYSMHREPPGAPVASATEAFPQAASAPPTSPLASAVTGGDTGAASEEKADELIAQAQLAMRDRHFIEPADGSALALYRSALTLDPASGEARQGLKRLAEVLVSRVQTALDEKQYEAALQALETVRNIDPGDARLAALDERIARMREELGPAEIEAAIGAQNFERAAQLIEQAARGKTLPEPKLAQLREDLRRRRVDSQVRRLAALVDARLAEDKLVEPVGDSAQFYLDEARKAGATPAQIQNESRELIKRLTAAAHAAIDQRRFGDAERFAPQLRAAGAPMSSVAGVERDIGLARAQQARESAGPPGGAARAAGESAAAGQAQPAAPAGAGRSIDSSADRQHPGANASGAGPAEVPEATLVRARRLEVEYPWEALSKKVEGSVEVGFAISAKGAVSDVKILSSNPGGVFDKAASKAVERLRYQPPMDQGKAVPVTTKMLVIFRLAH